MESHYGSTCDTTITHAYYGAYATHGDLCLRLDIFRSYLISIVAKHLGRDAPALVANTFVKALHTNDLYLTHACANGVGLAWERFSELYDRFIRELAHFFITVKGNGASELADNIVANLFMPDQSGQSRIASYEGRSSLATWLRVVISHCAINERARLCNKVEGLDFVLDVPDESALHKMHASLRASRYGTIIGDSLRSSCKCLTYGERLILLLRYEDEMQLGQIARFLGVHQSTVTRQIERICKKLRDQVTTVLITQYKLDEASIKECREDVLENPSYSILSLIEGRHAL